MNSDHSDHRSTVVIQTSLANTHKKERQGDMNITIFGATGQVGRRIVDEALVVGGAGPLVVPDSGGRLVVDDPRFVPAQIRGVARACVEQLNALRQNSTVCWTYFSPSAEMSAGQRTGQFLTGTNELIVDSEGTSRISLEDVAVAVLDEAEQPRHIRAVLTAGYSHQAQSPGPADPSRRTEVTP